MDGNAYLDFMKVALLCVMWYASSTSDNILGKLVLSDFPYPMTMAMTHLVTASLCLGPITTMLKVPKGRTIPKRYFYAMIFPLAFGKFISSVLSYVSIWKVSVSYAHTVKATLPLFTVFLSRVILGEKQTWPVYLSLAPIITGVCIATATELSFDSVGLASSVSATFFFSLQTIFTKKCLKETEYHHLQLLTLITRISTMLFLPVWLVLDGVRIYADEQFLSSGKVSQSFIFLVCAGLFNMMHNVLAFSVLAMVTPLSYAVANATKRIAIIGGSLIILQNPVGPLNIAGMLTAVFGVLIYNKAKYDQHQAKRRKEVLPHVQSTADLNTHYHGHQLPHHNPHQKIPNHLLLNAITVGGTHHLVHSKSDIDFLNHPNGLISPSEDPRLVESVQGASDLHPNQLLLQQRWDRGTMNGGYTLIPPVHEEDGRGLTATNNTRLNSVLRGGPGSNNNLYSRAVFQI
ncbi:solute carrier family 35 member e1-like protein [Plakobranchus ocellatus]|uniref:Solute carrier family 35 member e1-like protein n=1 Tax=Plakobranchus ocellatus TaxID=259542 RepID=A0AAV3ZMD1_9GAST|nr:solute carrier family 35 member e1-like protein [Plakobranchus ocellatus]